MRRRQRVEAGRVFAGTRKRRRSGLADRRRSDGAWRHRRPARREPRPRGPEPERSEYRIERHASARNGPGTTDKIASSWTDAFTADIEQPTTVRTASSGTDIARSNDDPLAGAAPMVTHEARNSATPRGRTRGIRDEVREPSGDILMRIATRAQYFPDDDARANRPEAGRSTCLTIGGRPARAARPDGGGSQRLGARAR
jgi:hypothetical protein